MKYLEIRMHLEQIDESTYDLSLEHINKKSKKASKALNHVKMKIFTSESMHKIALKKFNNPSKI